MEAGASDNKGQLMSDIRWDRYLGVRWDHVDWLYDHPEHIDRESPSREEAIALKRVIAGDRRILVNCGWPTIPPPLSHFDRPQHHRRPAEGPDPHHRWLRFQLACQFAGFQDPPDIERMQVWLRAERPDPGAVPALYNLFTCMNPTQVPHLLLGENLTVHELVRAIHISGVRSEFLARQLEAMADPPIRPRYLEAWEADVGGGQSLS